VVAELLGLVFPRSCVGCDRDDVLFCTACAASVVCENKILLDGLPIRSCAPYAGTLRAAITEFKHGRRAFAHDLAALIVPFVDASMTLVPVPTTRRRRAERGFDQTIVLAGVLARRTGVGVADILRQRGKNAQQGRSRAERLASSGRFTVRRPSTASGDGFVLFDDVRTTGATLLDAARTLRDSGILVSGALTLAWTPRENS
jgi:ComF family protein